MAYQDCEDCGGRMYSGFCVNCDEETFIEEQYLMDGESVPIGIAELAGEQRAKRRSERKELEGK